MEVLYDGNEIIKPEDLKAMDSTELAIPYGNNAKLPVQKYRDLLKIWSVMTDEKAVYVILGAEIQDKVHYAMPIKNGLYDMLGYSKQITEITRSYRRENKDEGENGELIIQDGTLKIKLTSEEFLSGIRKEDKLIPIITVVIYLGESEWDGPRSLYDMLDIQSDELKKYIPNYWINLISPADMDEKEFDRFNTDLGFAMKIIKHQSKDVYSIISESNNRKIDSETAVFLNKTLNLKFDFEERKAKVDMCTSMDRKYKEKEVEGAIKMLRADGLSEDDIIIKVMRVFNVTKEYVITLISPQKITN